MKNCQVYEEVRSSFANLKFPDTGRMIKCREERHRDAPRGFQIKVK